MAVLPAPSVVDEAGVRLFESAPPSIAWDAIGVWLVLSSLSVLVVIAVWHGVGRPGARSTRAVESKIGARGSGVWLLRSRRRLAGLDDGDAALLRRAASESGVPTEALVACSGAFDAAFDWASREGELDVGPGAVLGLRGRLFGGVRLAPQLRRPGGVGV